MPQSSIRLADDPHLRRWMMFIDGENLTIRAQELAKAREACLLPGQYYSANVFIWMPNIEARANLAADTDAPVRLQWHATRSFYYTAIVGDQNQILSTKEKLWNLGFSPEVFKRPSGQMKAKGVDITLTKDMLSNAFLDNYDVAVLIAGDGDYVPLVTEVKRLGKLVYVAFFSSPGAGLSPELRLSSDLFLHMDDFFFEQWQAFTSQTDAEDSGSA